MSENKVTETKIDKRKLPKPKYVPTKEEREQFGIQYVEDRAYRAALDHVGGNISKAAVLLGVNRRTVQRKLYG